MTTTYTEQRQTGRYVKYGVLGAVAFVLIFLLLLVGWPAVSRWNARNELNQTRAQNILNAQNQVQVTGIQIQNQEQRVKIAQQQAAIRLQNAIGVREAQDEISKTLTPLYVQFEMVDALRQIAESGKNNTVVYIPSGANGIPLVAGAAGAPRVGGN